ncbi:helix-turn-helix transcriptional regulator [Sandaracinus amylolyticus]|uniref:HTH luxR-type domain-containing protein n=1 Tax=Sandaracinus amylolyticus TaxID=927083 RepID=A0A0F6YGW8_9BACT|nr:LuxR C-terminal-related transcriptional regulator [Sandaracinus amylolyticus]AKF05157.1 hypothetical protein DB32_002306 [Sandaracinus amylolyticus]
MSARPLRARPPASRPGIARRVPFAPTTHVVVALGDLGALLPHLGSWSETLHVVATLDAALDALDAIASPAGVVAADASPADAAILDLHAAQLAIPMLLLCSPHAALVTTPRARVVRADENAIERVSALGEFVAAAHCAAGRRAMRFEDACQEWRLTPREAEVLWWTHRGRDCAGIASAMTLADGSVRALLADVRRKIGLRSIPSMVAEVQFRLAQR